LIKIVVITLTMLLFLSVGMAGAWQPETCKQCHNEQYIIWNSSAHADSLKAAGGSVVDIESCTECHVESSIKEAWGREDVETTIEPITCEVCHRPPETGYDSHIDNPSSHIPNVNLSAGMCGNCHTDSHHPIIDEWDEYSSKDFDMESMASHSEPTDVAEPFILERDNSCVSCKSTDGAIVSLEDESIDGLNLDEVPQPEDVEEWSIACVSCHEPHSAQYRIEGALLCGNCHNGMGAVPDGMTTEIHHPNWEMYNESIYKTGNHPEIGCSDCHMASKEYNETTEEAAVTGHTFDYEPELLFSLESSSECYDCHDEEFAKVIETKQDLIAEKIEELKTLQNNASVALENLNGTASYEKNLENYNNAVFYMHFVEEDGSLGIHNMEKANEYLNKSGKLFNSVIESEKPVEQPGFEAIVAIFGLMFMFWIVKRRD